MGGSTPIAVAVVLVLASSLLFWQWPHASLLGLLALRVAIPSFELPNLLLAVGGAVGLAVAGAALPPKRIVVPLAAFLGVGAVSLPLVAGSDIAAVDRWLTIPVVDLPYFPRGLIEAREWLRVASVLVIAWLAFSVSRTAKDCGRMVGAVLVSGVICVGIGLWQWVTGATVSRQGFEGIAGPFSHPSYFAHYLLLVIVVGLVPVLRGDNRLVRVLCAAIVSGALVCLFLTYSRSAWIGFVVALAILALLEYRRIIVVLAIALPLTLVVFPQALENAERRFDDLSAESGASSGNSWDWRKGHWSRMRPYAFDRPLTGHGFGSYHAVTVQEFGNRTGDAGATPENKDNIKGINAHNDYLKSLVEMGLPGFVLWGLVWLGWVWACLSARGSPAVRGYATALLGVVVALIGIGSADNVRDEVLVLVALAALIGAVQGASRRGPSTAVA